MKASQARKDPKSWNNCIINYKSDCLFPLPLMSVGNFTVTFRENRIRLIFGMSRSKPGTKCLDT